MVSVDGSTITACLDNRPGLMGNELTGILHGGVVASMIDSVGGFVAGKAARLRLEELGEAVERIQKIATVDMRVDYLSPGRGDYFIVTGSALKSSYRRSGWFFTQCSCVLSVISARKIGTSMTRRPENKANKPHILKNVQVSQL